MEFFSRCARYKLILEPATTKFVAVAGKDGLVAIPQRGTTVEFEPLSKDADGERGFEYRGTYLPANDKRLRGSYVTDDPKIIKELLHNDSYGVAYIAFDDDDGRTVLPEEFVIQPLVDGKARCLACDRMFKSRAGAEGHTESKEHQANLEDYKSQFKNRIDSLM